MVGALSSQSGYFNSQRREEMGRKRTMVYVTNTKNKTAIIPGRSVFDYLGMPVTMEKPEGLATALTFLGIEIDTKEMILCLPTTKLTELQGLVSSWLGKKSC